MAENRETQPQLAALEDVASDDMIHIRFGAAVLELPAKTDAAAIASLLQVLQKLEEPTEKTLVAAHERKKKRTNKELTKELPTKEICIDLPEDQKICSECGKEMVCIGKKLLYEELQIIPKQVIHVKYYANTYACKHCEEQTGFGHLVSVKAPARLLKHSLASPSTVADVMTQKYVNGIPLYRQEQIWKREGVRLPRATLANWWTSSRQSPEAS